VIEVRGLTKRYGSTVAVDRLSFDVPPGAVTGFLGLNGSGKSTTMRMILGLDAPDAGHARIGGQALLIPVGGPPREVDLADGSGTRFMCSLRALIGAGASSASGLPTAGKPGSTRTAQPWESLSTRPRRCSRACSARSSACSG
jgi:energy-coupling factor transporter ATP-binding protein EcfA2